MYTAGCSANYSFKWLHTIGTCHNVDRLIFNDRIFNLKIVCEDHFQKGCGTCIAGQFVHRHQAMDAIAPRKAPESFAVKRAQVPPKTFLFRYSFRLIPYNIQVISSSFSEHGMVLPY